MYSLLAKCRNMHLPVDLQIDLFKKLVKQILLYGCEIWEFGNGDVIERVQIKFIKQSLSLKSSSPNYIVYGGWFVPSVYRYLRTNHSDILLGKTKSHWEFWITSQ